ncbi:MAG: hypothetical protein ACYTGR_16570 [Planctomycetota bacterium]
MLTLLMTICATALGSNAPFASPGSTGLEAGLSPEQFARSLHRVMQQQRLQPPSRIVTTIVTAAHATVSGRVWRVNDDHFVLLLRNGELFRVTVTDKTVYRLDGRKSSHTDALEIGRKATVTHTGKTASRVEVDDDDVAFRSASGR